MRFLLSGKVFELSELWLSAPVTEKAILFLLSLQHDDNLGLILRQPPPPKAAIFFNERFMAARHEE